MLKVINIELNKSWKKEMLKVILLMLKVINVKRNKC